MPQKQNAYVYKMLLVFVEDLLQLDFISFCSVKILARVH